MPKYASFYKRLEIVPNLLYVNLSKQGVSVSFGPKGAKLQIPVYNASVERKPKVWLQRSVLGVRLQYRRSLSIDDKVEDAPQTRARMDDE